CLLDSPTPSASRITYFEAQYPACRYPCPTLQVQHCCCPRMSRGQVDRYSLPVRLFHSLLHAGLSRRYLDFSVPSPLLARGRNCPSPSVHIPTFSPRQPLAPLPHLSSKIFIQPSRAASIA